MKLCKADNRICSSTKPPTSLSPVLLILLALFCTELRQSAHAQTTDTPVLVANIPLTTQQVVENLVRRNLDRAQALHAYQGTRIYGWNTAVFQGPPTPRWSWT
jgi:hypothetical protein